MARLVYWVEKLNFGCDNWKLCFVVLDLLRGSGIDCMEKEDWMFQRCVLLPWRRGSWDGSVLLGWVTNIWERKMLCTTIESNHHSKNSWTLFYVSLDTSTQINRQKKAYSLIVLHSIGYETIKHLKQSLICFAYLANESANSKILVFLLAEIF